MLRRARAAVGSRFLMLVVATAAVALATSSLEGANKIWNVTSGDWSTASNWTGGLPGASDTASIANGGTAKVTHGGGSSATCLTLNLSGGVVSLSGTGKLNATTEYVGNSGTGTFTQTGGTTTNTVSQKFYIGFGSVGSGTYNLSSGGSLGVASEVRVGADGGYGRFEWFANSLTVPTLTLGSRGTLAIGFDFGIGALTSGALFNGTTLSGLSSARLEITNGATVTHTGSSSVAVGMLTLGTSAGSGAYNLNSMATLRAAGESVGSEPSVPIIGETTASLVITVEGKEVE